MSNQNTQNHITTTEPSAQTSLPETLTFTWYNQNGAMAEEGFSAIDQERGLNQQEQERIKALRMNWNPLSWFSVGYQRWFKAASLRRQMRRLDAREDQFYTDLGPECERALAPVFDSAALSVDLQSEDFQEYKRILRVRRNSAAAFLSDCEFLDETRDTLSVVDSARSAASSAESMEYFDAFTDNTALSVLSYMETSSAADSIKKAAKKLESFKDRMVKYRSERLDNDISGDDIDALFDSNNFDLLVDLVSEFAGMFTSLSNAAKLSDAEGKLSKAASQIKEVEAALLETAHSDALKFVTAERMINRLRKRLVERASSLPENIKSDVLATLNVRTKVLELLSEDIERAKGQGHAQIVRTLPRVMVSAASKTPIPS